MRCRDRPGDQKFEIPSGDLGGKSHVQLDVRV